MNGMLYNNSSVADKLWFDSYNDYEIKFTDGTVRHTRARGKSDAEDNVRWFGNEDRLDDIVSVEEM